MNFLCVDDEKIGLEAQIDTVMKVAPGAPIFAFRNGEEAIEIVKSGVNIDVALLDIKLRGMNGIVLAQKIKLLNPKINIIFVTGFDNYLGEAFALHASGYIMKPITEKKVRDELENLRNPVSVKEDIADIGSSSQKGRVEIRVRAFGNFEIFADNEPMKFKYEKTREMIAYMVDRQGALCSNGDIISNLWEDDGNHSSYLRGIRKDLIDCLESIGRTDIIYHQRGKIGINTDAIICDYYQFLSGDPKAINTYQGEYMRQYSWGELTNASLDLNRFV